MIAGRPSLSGGPEPAPGAPSPSAGSRHDPPAPGSPQQLDMISDPSRLLALYPLGGPHVPSSSVAHHLASLTNSPIDVRNLVPRWHEADDFEEQLRVLESGGGETEAERAWFAKQVEGVRAVADLPSVPPARPDAARPSFVNLITSLLPSPAPLAPPSSEAPMSASEAQTFFASFVNNTLASMAAGPPAQPPPHQQRASSPASSAGTITPVKPTSRRTSVAGPSRSGGRGYQPSPLGPSHSSPAHARANEDEYQHPPSSSPLVGTASLGALPRGLRPPAERLKLKRPAIGAAEGSPKRAKEEEGTPNVDKGKGRASSGGGGKVRTGGKTPGDAQKKLIDYVEDLLESLDTLPAILPATHPHFSRFTTTGSHPVLRADVCRKLDSLLAGARHWPAELGDAEGERLVLLLRGTFGEGDEAEQDALAFAAGSSPRKTPSPSKPWTANDKMEAEDTVVVSSSYSSPSYGGFDSTPPRPQPTGKKRARRDPEEERAERELERGLTASVLWRLMSTSGISKLFFSEELISLLTTHLSTLLKSTIYPSMLLPSPPPTTSSFVQSVTLQLAALSRLLAARDAPIVLSEDAVIAVVPLATGPFFAQGAVDDGAKRKGKRRASDVGVGKGKEGLKEIRMEALAVLRAIFGRYESQRSWVIQEVLTSLVKLPDIKKNQKQFRLRDGQAIHIVSALLLQLVQACAHGVGEQVKGRRLADESRMIVDGKEEEEEGQTSAEAEKEDAQIYTSSCDAAARIAKSIASFLTISSASSKATKSSEKEHRAVLDIVLQDLLTVLHWPEWPAASQVLSWFCKHMIASLKDDKASAEDNASKAIALDHLGHIAARMRQSALKAEARGRKGAEGISGTLPLTDIVKKSDRDAFEQLLKMQLDLLEHLRRAGASDVFLLSSYEYTACLWGQELSTEVSRLPAQDAAPAFEDASASSQISGLALTPQPSVSVDLRAALGSLWAEKNSRDVFLDDDDDATVVDDISEEINLHRPFGRAFDSTLSAILFALESHSVTFRTKALRALGHILVADSSILNLSNVRRSIENRLNDPSPAVRDVAVELIGQYLVTQSGLVEKYLPRLSERVDDSGLMVRKRVIKLLKTIYITLSDTSLQALIAIRLIQRADDEDETVKDLAVKTIEELWFSDPVDRAHSAELKSASPFTQGSSSNSLERKTAVIMLVASHFRERHSPLEVFLRQIVDDKQHHVKHAASVFQHYKEVCEALIDTLIDAHERPSLDIGGCVHALNQFSAAYPDCVSSSKASHLLPYLRHSTAPDEQAISISLLRIFNRSIRKMPKTSLSFAQSLEKKVLPLINGAMGGWMGLQESIACLCVTVDHLTQNHERLVRLLGSCTNKLEQLRRRYQQTGQLPIIKVQVQARPLLYIVALLGEHCDFDELRANNDVLGQELNTISEEFMSEYIFDLVAFFEKAPVIPDLRRAALQSLGFLFRGYPTLMVEPSSIMVMDSVFASADLQMKAVLLDVIHDFLITQVERVKKEPVAPNKGAATDSVNMTELIGDTEKFAESGVGSTVVQRYLGQILDAARHSQTERVAVEIITFTVKQGLAHPIELAPVVISLETSSNPALADRAYALHAYLHHKYNSIVNTRFVENAKACFLYQADTAEGGVRGYRLEVNVTSAEPVTEALMGRWYNLVREKRQMRKDYLRHLLRPFDFDALTDSAQVECTSMQVAFCRFLADNFAAFEYKTQEEIFIVVERLTSIISVTGTYLFDLLSRAKLDFEGEEMPVDGHKIVVRAVAKPRILSQLASSSSETDELPDASDDTVHAAGSSAFTEYDALTLANLSIVTSFAFILKAHLKALYQLSEDKCRKFDSGAKKSAVGDKAASRCTGASLILDFDGVPFALKEIRQMSDVFEQCNAFITLAEEDGTNLEPEDDSA